VTDRRTVIRVVVGCLVAVPLMARAQQSPMPVIGYLGNGKPSAVPSRQLEAFRRSLRALGWIENQNIRIEYRYAEGNPYRLPALVAELVQARVDVIMLSGPAASLARRQGLAGNTALT
jgi:putative ABC transport system substrate-binding protein